MLALFLAEIEKQHTSRPVSAFKSLFGTLFCVPAKGMRIRFEQKQQATKTSKRRHNDAQFFDQCLDAERRRQIVLVAEHTAADANIKGAPRIATTSEKEGRKRQRTRRQTHSRGMLASGGLAMRSCNSFLAVSSFSASAASTQ